MGISRVARSTAVCLAWTALSLRASEPQVSDLHATARVGGGPASNVVVWLDAPDASAIPSRGRVVLDQRNLTFSPHVLAVRVGSTVDFPNNDRVLHNVFSFRDGKRFDLGMYPVGVLRRVTFNQVGLSRIFCNIHPNMAAYVMTVDSPYFAVSNDDGRLTIASIAQGVYRYHAWRAGAADLTGMWSSADAQPLSLSWP